MEIVCVTSPADKASSVSNMKGSQTLSASEDPKPRYHYGEVLVKEENLKRLRGGPGLPAGTDSLLGLGAMFRNPTWLEDSGAFHVSASKICNLAEP